MPDDETTKPTETKPLTPLTNRERFMLLRGTIRARIFSQDLAMKRQELILDRLVLGLTDRLGQAVQDRVSGFLGRMDERLRKLGPR